MTPGTRFVAEQAGNAAMLAPMLLSEGLLAPVMVGGRVSAITAALARQAVVNAPTIGLPAAQRMADTLAQQNPEMGAGEIAARGGTSGLGQMAVMEAGAI